jgi:2-aminoethylphosphonate-pyruvate transaminase
MQVIAEALESNQVACVAMTHHETTTGLRNPVAEVGRLAKEHGATFIVDAISSFGGIPFSLSEWNIDFMVGSSNKCLQGVPGVPFVIARREALRDYPPRTLSLNLYSQWKSLEDTGQSLFTPNTHAMLALKQALRELDDEGGIEARFERYTANWKALRAGLVELGFELLLKEEDEAHMLITAKQPPGFDYEEFYKQMKERGITIYSGKLATLAGEATLRFGVIGDLHLPDIERLLAAIKEVRTEE